ncbi:MAG: hypothetical protein DI582_08305 [Azospirillum brasilense]|nr:MAG: hypothetical protein DI582_08305 [Azospirillum brasilense]
MWSSVIAFLSSTSAPYLFCGIILLVFLFALVDAWARLSSAQIAVKRGINTVQNAANRQVFFEQFESLSDQFTRQPLFANAWSEFAKTVIIDGARQLVRITRRPHDFFNERSLVNPRINLRQMSAMPGYLISLGLFFTFIGLVAAIAIAAQGIGNDADVSKTQNALVNLLDVASLKFISSVAGISLSIILSFVQKALLNRVGQSIHKFCDAVEARTQLITTEQLLYQWLIAQEQTTRNFGHLAEDIATEVALQLSPQA